MKDFGQIDDRLVFPNREAREIEDVTWNTRRTVKAIVLNAEDQIGLVTNPVHGLFLLPGGGVEEGETLEEAIERECKEEVGFSVEVLESMGSIVEFRDRDGNQYETLLFVAKTIKPGHAERTEDEIKNGLEIKWISLEEASLVFKEQLERLKRNEINFYNSGFNVYRDAMFFEHFLQTHQR